MQLAKQFQLHPTKAQTLHKAQAATEKALQMATTLGFGSDAETFFLSLLAKINSLQQQGCQAAANLDRVLAISQNSIQSSP